MAYYDVNGKLMLDEQVARKDLRRIDEALFRLQEITPLFGQLREASATMKGETARALGEKSTDLEVRVKEVMDSLKTTQELIEFAVAHYQQLDQELRRMAMEHTYEG